MPYTDQFSCQLSVCVITEGGHSEHHLGL